MYIELSGTHASNMLLRVNLPIDDSKYKKIGEDVQALNALQDIERQFDDNLVDENGKNVEAE